MLEKVNVKVKFTKSCNARTREHLVKLDENRQKADIITGLKWSGKIH